jgi:hypothetical protein
MKSTDLLKNFFYLSLPAISHLSSFTLSYPLEAPLQIHAPVTILYMTVQVLMHRLQKSMQSFNSQHCPALHHRTIPDFHLFSKLSPTLYASIITTAFRNISHYA